MTNPKAPTPTLRPYQQRVLDELAKRHGFLSYALLIHHPGLGKNIILDESHSLKEETK